MFIMGDHRPEGIDHCGLQDPRGNVPDIFFRHWEAFDEDNTVPLFLSQAAYGRKTVQVRRHTRRILQVTIPSQW